MPNGLLKRRINRGISRFFLIIICICFVLPLYWMVISALKTPEELTKFPPSFFVKEPVWVNFVKAIRFIPFLRYFANTLFIALTTCVGAVISNYVIAYGFSMVKWPGRDLLFYTVLVTIFIFITFPVNIITMLPLFKFFAKLGLVNTYYPLIVPAFLGNPFFIFLVRQYLKTVPFEISEASYIDGAGEFTIMTRVILPLAKPCLGVVMIMVLVGSWNDFMGPLIYLHDGLKYTLSIGLTQYKSNYLVEWNLLMAAAALVVLPEVLIFLSFQRYFIEGINVGGVKS